MKTNLIPVRDGAKTLAFVNLTEATLSMLRPIIARLKWDCEFEFGRVAFKKPIKTRTLANSFDFGEIGDGLCLCRSIEGVFLEYRKGKKSIYTMIPNSPLAAGFDELKELIESLL